MDYSLWFEERQRRSSEWIGRIADRISDRSTGSYRFENWKRARAPRWPYFLRSFLRGSRVT
jgi:hypothetical protein